MDIQDYLQVVWRRKLLIVLTAVMALIVVVIATSREVPRYQASTTLRMATSASGQLSYITSTYTAELLSTSAKIATSKPVLDSLKTELGVNQLPEITVEVVPNTELLKITVEGTSPKLVTDAANTLAKILINQSNNLYVGGGITSPEVLSKQMSLAQSELADVQKQYQNLIVQTPAAPEVIDMTFQLWTAKQKNYDTLLQQYQQAQLQEEIRSQMMTVVDPAVIPSRSVNPSRLYGYLLGLFAGFVGGLFLTFVLASFDSTLYQSKQIEAVAGLPILASIPRTSQMKVKASLDGNSSFAEAFRKLALNIEQIHRQRSSKVFMVISAEPGEGRTTFVYNLARSLSERGNSVVAVDGNLRLPDLHKSFGLENQEGMKEVLEGEIDLETALQKSSETDLYVLTGGTSTEKPSQLLGSSKMKELLDGLRQRYEYILVDTPALLAVADAPSIAGLVDGILLVVSKEHTKKESVQATNKFLLSYPDQWVGLVVNRDQDNAGYYYYAGKRQLIHLPVPIQNLAANFSRFTRGIFAPRASTIDHGRKELG